jgi:hypothetical protein
VRGRPKRAYNTAVCGVWRPFRRSPFCWRCPCGRSMAEVTAVATDTAPALAEDTLVLVVAPVVASAAPDTQVASPAVPMASMPTAARSPVRLLHAPLVARLHRYYQDRYHQDRYHRDRHHRDHREATPGRSLVRRFLRTDPTAPTRPSGPAIPSDSAITATATPVAATAITLPGHTDITIPTGCGIPARPMTVRLITTTATTRMSPPPPR